MANAMRTGRRDGQSKSQVAARGSRRGGYHAIRKEIKKKEKELLDKQNLWLDEELTTKANTLVELRRSQMDVEADLTGKIAEVNKLAELYKGSSEEWSKKAGELEGVIKALETHLNQVADDYKEKLEKESSLRKDLEKESDNLRMQLEKCEAELESTRKANEFSLLPLSILPFNTNVEEPMIGEVRSDLSQDSTRMLVPRVAAGVSGTALAASLLRDGWSLTKMYEKYQEAADALRHEKWGRRHAETVLERVLQEIEEKAEMILEERAGSLEHESYENALRKSKAELRRRERECSIAQKEINDLQKQVTVLLKECQDIQLRCGGTPQVYLNDSLTATANFEGGLLDTDQVISQQHLNFKDISELVEQNVKLRSLVHKLAADIEKKEAELKDEFQVDLQRIADEAESKVEVVLKRSEEQASMIDSLHSSVAMYKRLYEEEQKFRSYHAPTTTVSDDGKKELMLLFEGSQDVSKKAYEHLSNRAKILEEELSKLSMELISARAERDKMLLEANFSKERLDSFIKEFDQQRVESNAVSARNIELTHLIVDYQKRLRENTSSLQVTEENLRKLSLEVSILKHEKEILVSSEKRASAEVQSLTERVHRLQTSLDTIQSAEEIRENGRAAERRKQDDYLRLIERDWAEAKKELQEERDRVRSLTLEKEKVTETSMRQVEDIQKELASAWHAVAAAESKAAVSEARFADLEARFKHAGKQVMTDVGKDDPTVLSTHETSEELWKVKEELEKVKDEARASKDYMLQYKEVARTNEIALKQIEIAHENYKSEALKLKQALEDEVQSLKGQIFEFERSYAIKCEEAASANEAKEKALSSAMVETSRLRDEVAAKLKMVGEMEIQVANLKDDLDKEHKRWRIAQDNYERQVILQSETIQELTNTSKELSIMQAEDLLKSSWEKKKTELQHMCHEDERQFSETDEQNKILHNRLEALHVRLAEKEQSSVGKSTVGSEGDGDLQKVISYLRRSKEITETEITLLKQEKLRLQSKLEGAIKASESAQVLLRSQLKRSSELLLKDEEFKSLQLQVREINLLRESNVQLREENKHNFEECQKFHDEAHRARAEAENLENLLKLKQIEVDTLQKDVEVLKNEIGNLNNKNTEMVERYKNINIHDYEEVKVQLEQYKESINKLEEELSGCREELCEREKKLNDAQKAEAQLIQDIERQKKHINVKSQILAKKKEEFSSKIQALSKELEDLKIKNCALVSENEELSSRNQALTKDRDDLNAKIQSLTKDKDELLSKSLTSTKERDELNSKIQALLKQIEDLKSGRKVPGEMPTEQIKKEEEKRQKDIG
ncbi:hypothetical protein HPP92_017349 [Vanilla planifolia]|uniref:Nuclear-pore anchor n=1 Tax=Vanilla planifolia TaxID=51239 RepID=A0A835UPB7_VANPL|nr:hypothetical protein HPP92_017349 [Vanilla planifolia]